MRVTFLEVSGFRAFSGSERFDLDGDIVLVIGANGQGKTSLFDAIHWAITGHISRFGRPESVVSLYSNSGEARVAVTIRAEGSRSFTVTRHFDGQVQGLMVTEGDREYRGAEAEHELLRRLWPQGLAAGDPRAALHSTLERGVYLQQDMLTKFLTADTAQERFDAVSELVGTGRATELQATLERSRNAWTRVTNQRESQAVDTEARLSRLETRQRALADMGPITSGFTAEWTDWWTRAEQLGISDMDPPSVESPAAARAIDAAMGQLRVIRSAREHRGDLLRALAAKLRDGSPTTHDLNMLRQVATEARSASIRAREALAEAEGRAAGINRRRLETRSAREEFRSLATLALRHLGEHCPVCQQTYDTDATRERLEALLRDSRDGPDSLDSMPDLPAIAERASVMETVASRAEAEVEDALTRQDMEVAREEEIRRRLAELAIDVPSGTDRSAAVESASDATAREIERLSTAGTEGETLALSLARSGQIARRGEVDREVSAVRRDLELVRSEIEARQRTGALVSKMINGLRDASSHLVEDELRRLGPLLQRIYDTADPHPAFRVVRLISRMSRGHGRVLAEVEDPLHELQSETPDAILSSSQMNVLAVSVFLALNLGMPTPPLQTAILDDPLQSLDDLNLLGLTDLLRRMRERRQLMVSTHDSRFAALLERKLRPVSDSQRTIVIELRGWSSEGTMVIRRDVMRDPAPVRIAAA